MSEGLAGRSVSWSVGLSVILQCTWHSGYLFTLSVVFVGEVDDEVGGRPDGLEEDGNEEEDQMLYNSYPGKQMMEQLPR